ncbi:MAG: CheR family methyltransferase [Luteibaculum sp.]
MSTANEIGDEELASLTTAIRNRYGIDFTNYESKSLKRGFARLIMKHKFGSILGLWQKILSDREYFMSCIDDLTVNLTELFRNPEIWVRLRDDILNRYENNFRIKMWHAGCSTGEEVYTMAMVLKDKGLLHKCRTHATDLSSTALAKAMEGKYSSLLMNKYTKTFQQYLPNGKIEDCFIEDGRYMRIHDDLKKHIDFQQHNLVNDKMDRKFDIIFCRNVMIYFDDNLKMKVLKLFHECLEKDGVFIIGYYDMLPEASKELFQVYDSKMKIYTKK